AAMSRKTGCDRMTSVEMVFSSATIFVGFFLPMMLSFYPGDPGRQATLSALPFLLTLAMSHSFFLESHFQRYHFPYFDGASRKWSTALSSSSNPATARR